MVAGAAAPPAKSEEKQKECLVGSSHLFLSVLSSPASSVPHFRYITILSPEDPNRSVAGKPEEGVDLRTLRAIRVLRPLKLVSGVPSK